MGWPAKMTWRWEHNVPPTAGGWQEIVRFLGYDPRPQIGLLAAD